MVYQSSQTGLGSDLVVIAPVVSIIQHFRNCLFRPQYWVHRLIIYLSITEKWHALSRFHNQKIFHFSLEFFLVFMLKRDEPCWKRNLCTKLFLKCKILFKNSMLIHTYIYLMCNHFSQYTFILHYLRHFNKIL